MRGLESYCKVVQCRRHSSVLHLTLAQAVDYSWHCGSMVKMYIQVFSLKSDWEQIEMKVGEERWYPREFLENSSG